MPVEYGTLGYLNDSKPCSGLLLCELLGGVVATFEIKSVGYKGGVAGVVVHWNEITPVPVNAGSPGAT